MVKCPGCGCELMIVKGDKDPDDMNPDEMDKSMEKEYKSKNKGKLEEYE